MSEPAVWRASRRGAVDAVSRPIFIAFSVVFVLGTWAQNVAIIGWISKFCRLYILVWRELWANLFAWTEDWFQIELIDYQLDLLTLIATIVMISGLTRLIVSAAMKSVNYDTSDRTEPELDVASTQLSSAKLSTIEWLLVALSILFIAFPFFNAFAAAINTTSELQNELQAKYADISQTPDASWFERLMFAPPGISSEIIQFGNYWSVPIMTMALILSILMLSKKVLIALAYGLVSSIAAFALAVWVFGFLHSTQIEIVMINTALCAALGFSLGTGLRYSARSFYWIAAVAILIMTADFAIAAISSAMSSVERSAVT